jgi:hypothetical protein
MTLEEILYQYEINSKTIQQNENGDWDYDISPVGIKFDETSTDFNPDMRTRILEESTIKLLQDLFDKQGWEFKNGTNGIYSHNILVEHHQFRKVKDEVEPSGILVSKAAYWWYGIDDIGFIVLKKEFLVWLYEYNLQYKMMIDRPIESQKNGNTGYAFLIPYSDLCNYFRIYKKYLQT